MSLTEFTRRLIDKRLTEYCRRKLPSSISDQARLTFTIQWNKVTLIKRRPNGKEAAVRLLQPIAQMRYDDLKNRWTLYYADRNSDWHLYPGIKASPNFDHLLAEIDSDPTGIFHK